jgi:hypothetical protein
MIRARDFRAWKGLSDDCTPERLAKDLPRSNPNEGGRQLGSDAIDVDWWPAEVAGYREPLEVSISQVNGWPERGIAIYVGSDAKFVRRVALFRSTDLATYQRLLQPSLRSYDE